MERQRKVSDSESQLPFAVIVGACGHGLSIIRALDGHGMPIVALEANKKLPGVRTRLAQVQIVGDINGPGLIDSLLALHPQICQAGTPVLFLTNDRMVRTVGENWDRLAHAYRLSWAHARRAMLPLLEKSELERRSLSQGLLYPKSFLLNSAGEIACAIETVEFPILVKPAKPLARFKTAQPASPEELERLVSDFQSDLPFIVQRFIPGDDRSIYFCAVYLDRGRVLARFDGHKIRSRPLGHTTIAESSPNDEVFEQTCTFFDGLDISGPASLELKRDPQGLLWVIEPTVGRTDFWLDVCTTNGVNLPLTEYLHQCARSIQPQAQSDRAIWFNEERDFFGCLWFLFHKELRFRSRRPSFLYLHRSDLLPARDALIAVTARIGNAIGLRARKAICTTRRKEDSRDLTVFALNPTDPLPQDVRALLDRAETIDIEFGSTWCRILVQTVFPNDDGAQLYVLRKNNQAVAVLPIHIAQMRMGCKVESLGNFYTTLYSPALVPNITAADLAHVFKAIRRDHGSARSFRFAPMNPMSAEYGLIDASLRSAGMMPFHFFCFGNWRLPVNTPWSNYFDARPGILRTTVKRMSARLKKQGGRLELITGGADLERGMNAYAQVYAASWKNAEPFPEFLPTLMRTSAENGWLRLGVAWIQDQPIAAQVWLVANGRAMIYKLAYHESYKSLAPGTLLTAMMMRHAFENDKVVEVDYLNGDEPYKQDWMSHRGERWGIIGYDPRNLFGLVGLMGEILGKTRRFATSAFPSLLRNDKNS